MGLSLTVEKTIVQDCVVLKWKSFEDDRGIFYESFNENSYLEAGLPTQWVQDNISISKPGVLRGLHVQANNSQGKLIQCIQGKILDVCLDIRPDSPSFGKWHMQELTGTSALYCPPGTAHGFYSYDHSVVYYKCSTLYDNKSDGGIYAYDPTISIPWPDAGRVIMSGKDLALPKLSDYMEQRYGGDWKRR